MNTYAKKIGWKAASVLVCIGVIYLWQLVADAQFIPRVFLPGPNATWAALLKGMHSGRLSGLFTATAERMIYGWLLASLVGIAIGAIIGMSRTLRAYVEPSLEAIRPLPASAIIPIAIALTGLGDTTVYSVICFGALWPMLLSTVQGFSAVEPTRYEFARSIGMSRTATVLKIALPSSMPDLLAGLKLSLTVALILTVVVEMLTGQQGLGTWILFAGRAYHAPDLFAGIILLGVLGYASTLVFAMLERYMLRWRQRPE
ncbi:MAG: ABC transporter permease [Burkholderiaceae bacterium]|nr:MAG: ABC transporter permease [Burkholderiaceae bacterium]TAM02676.1 MAG: ABC transporter permease [Pusillimonas sp.]